MKKIIKYSMGMLFVVLLMIPIQTEAKTQPKLNQTKATIAVGKTVTLKVRDTKKTIKWKSNKKSIATVSSKGVVTGKKAGTATITASFGKNSIKCKITVKKKLNVLVVYFSHTGTTKKMARSIQRTMNADIFEIKVAKPYPADYDECVKVAAEELRQNARPKLSSKIKNMKKYDVVFIGYPIWWHSTPMPVCTFLESYNMSGKIIVPFCTSGGSDISETTATIRKLCKNTTIKKGLTIEETSDIKPWLKRIGLLN